MKRIAILGGGISGLTAAYELELARKRGADIDWHLYEASGRLGGIVQTTTRDGFVMEGGPDAWVSEKPWARDLAVELGLEDELIYSNDATRKTYILLDGRLHAIPQQMRLFVPESLAALESSELFSASARAAYAAEFANAEELKAHSPFAQPEYDESVANFVLRHFGSEVLDKLAAPLLSGVFGGDVHKLSARAVIPQFVAMEREHGSLIAGLEAKNRSQTSDTMGAPFIAQSHRAMSGNKPIFTSLRSGMGSLVDALVARLPPDRVHYNFNFSLLEDGGWYVLTGKVKETWHAQLLRPRSPGDAFERFDHVMLATPLEVTTQLLGGIGFQELVHQLPWKASSAVLVSLAWTAEAAATFAVPQGFGFLAPQQQGAAHHDFEMRDATNLQLLACTFVDQKFAHRAPNGGRILRAFYGGSSCEALAQTCDEDVIAMALTNLANILGSLPKPEQAVVTRWPRSLPQYEVGHLKRMDELDELLGGLRGLTLVGNSYRGVGLPDLIRDARAAARKVASRS